MYLCGQNMAIISYIRQLDGAIQSNEEHQQGVAQRAGAFANVFGMGDCGRIMGLLHDKGKEQAEWQKYIRGMIQNGPYHAYVGACIVQKQYPQIAPFIAQPIAGHHRGLYDYCDYVEVTKRDFPNDVMIGDVIPFSFPKFPKLEKYDYHQLVRMMFSCLADADSLDTESFMTPEQARLRGSQTSLEELLDKQERYLRALKSDASETEVKRIRNNASSPAF